MSYVKKKLQGGGQIDPPPPSRNSQRVVNRPDTLQKEGDLKMRVQSLKDFFKPKGRNKYEKRIFYNFSEKYEIENLDFQVFSAYIAFKNKYKAM